MTIRQLVVLGLVAAAPAVARADTVPTTGVVLDPDQAGDLLSTPSRETEGASRLGGPEIMNSPHASFGVGQSPDQPSRMSLRQTATGAPTVSGPQARANAADMHADRRAAAAEAAGISALTPEQIAANAANAQAAGVTAAVAQAATSQNARSGAGTASPETDGAPATLPDQTGAPTNRDSATPTDDGRTPGSTAAPGAASAPAARTTGPDVMPPDDASPDSSSPANPVDGATPPPPSAPNGEPMDATPPSGGASPVDEGGGGRP